MSQHCLRILITCRELERRAGTQLYTRDLAFGLRAAGHTPLVYAPRLGEVAEEVRARGVPVVDELERIGAAPDVIHGQHHLETMAAVSRFPAVPALFLCHGWLPFCEAPPLFPSLELYVAVDTLRRDRLVLEHGIPPGRVAILHNFVDLERFHPRSPLPQRPRRALLFSNLATREGLLSAVARACARRGIDVEAAGLGVENPTAAPESLLPQFDLVFARGRAALEAMAVGCGVVLCDLEGLGPFVTPENFDRLRDLNFGLGALSSPISDERLDEAIGAFAPAAAAAVQSRVRQEMHRDGAIVAWIALYRRLLEARSSRGTSADEALAACSRYLAWLSRQGVDLESQFAAERRRFGLELARAAEARQELERAVARETKHG